MIEGVNGLRRNAIFSHSKFNHSLIRPLLILFMLSNVGMIEGVNGLRRNAIFSHSKFNHALIRPLLILFMLFNVGMIEGSNGLRRNAIFSHSKFNHSLIFIYVSNTHLLKSISQILQMHNHLRFETPCLLC